MAQLALIIEANSLGERLLLTLSQSWVLHSIVASLSTLSFPSIPVNRKKTITRDPCQSGSSAA